MEQTLRDNLITLASAFESETGMSLATIGKRALNDNTYFARITEGQGFTIRTYDRVVRWLAAEWPKGLKWPRDIQVPEQVRAAS